MNYGELRHALANILYLEKLNEVMALVDAYSSASNGANPIVSGSVPPIEDEVLHYFYHIGAADALAKAISRNGGKPDFEKRLKEFREGQGGNDR